jgi:uncharacterized protein YecE (DUF72 family)
MIRIGPAGWSYKDWNGIVYPKQRPKGFHEAEYLSHYFDTIEINTSFYHPVRAQSAHSWVAKVSGNKNFRFTAKLWRGFTHERNATSADERLVKDGFTPLLEADRLGALLLQFPWSFKNTPEHRKYLLDLQSRFHEYPMVLEVRHSSWAEPEMLDMLAELGVGLCNIDQPLFSRSIAPSALSTSHIGYIRLHGRNYKQWFTENQNTGDRYNYLYTLDELEPWVARTKTVAKESKDTYVVTNNHFVGKATVNALEMASLLRGEPVPAPPELVEHYPQLREFTTT